MAHGGSWFCSRVSPWHFLSDRLGTGRGKMGMALCKSAPFRNVGKDSCGLTLGMALEGSFG